MTTNEQVSRQPSTHTYNIRNLTSDRNKCKDVASHELKLVYEEEILTDTISAIDLEDMEVEPVVISKIFDKTGRVGDMARAIEIETGYCAFPFSLLNFDLNIESIKNHDIVHLRGIKYCISTEIREDIISSWKTNIINKLESGLPFKESLWNIGNYDNREFNTLKLNFKEMAYLKSMFKAYKAGVYKNESNEDYIFNIDHLG